MTVSADQEKKVFARIDELRDEIIRVALSLSDMDASMPHREGEPPPRRGVGDIKYHERRAAEWVEAWMRENGFETKRQGAPDRFNMLGIHRGTGGGRSILFNSHMDVSYRPLTHWRYRDTELRYRVSAWRDGDSLVGQGIANCKGPMACWLIATKALKETGVQLPGDVLMSTVVGETGGAPVDEFPSPQFDSHELGARYVASHGGIADYVIVAEATGFGIVPAMTGFAYMKVTIFAGPSTYTPFMQRPEPAPEGSLNAIVRMASFILKFEQYAQEYNRRDTYSFDDGTVAPHTIVGAIRGGMPTQPTSTPELCSLYLDFRVAPGRNPQDMQRDLENILREMGTEGTVEMYKFLPGYEAWHNPGFGTLKAALTSAHTRVLDAPMEPVAPQFCSMWRDLNPYNEIGIPAVSYGFSTGYTQVGAREVMASARDTAVKIDDMVKAAKIYAATAMDLCSRSTGEPR